MEEVIEIGFYLKTLSGKYIYDKLESDPHWYEDGGWGPRFCPRDHPADATFFYGQFKKHPVRHDVADQYGPLKQIKATRTTRLG